MDHFPLPIARSLEPYARNDMRYLAFGIERENAAGLKKVNETLGRAGGVGNIVVELLGLQHEPSPFPSFDSPFLSAFSQPPLQRQLQVRFLLFYSQ